MKALALTTFGHPATKTPARPQPPLGPLCRAGIDDAGGHGGPLKSQGRSSLSRGSDRGPVSSCGRRELGDPTRRRVVRGLCRSTAPSSRHLRRLRPFLRHRQHKTLRATKKCNHVRLPVGVLKRPCLPESREMRPFLFSRASRCGSLRALTVPDSVPICGRRSTLPFSTGVQSRRP